MEATLTRRQVIAGMGAAIAAPSLLFRQDENRPVGWAVLGLGGYAQGEILPAFARCQRSKLVALISGHEEKLAHVGDRYGIAKNRRYLYDQMASIRNANDIEVVYVITPPATHRDFALRAASAGKHVCSEKPMAPTVADCRAMIEACRKARRLLQIGYRSHYEPNNRRAIEACRSGELGKIRSISSDHGFNIGPNQWRVQRALAGGGSMMDIGIYSLNALRYLSGEEPREVTATIANPPNDPRFKDVEDTVDFHLTFPSGLVGHGTSGYSWVQGKNRYEVVGEKATLHAEPATAYSGNRLTIGGHEHNGDTASQFSNQIDHLSECIRMRKPVRTPGEEGLRDIRIIQAIYESARTGKPVRL